MQISGFLFYRALIVLRRPCWFCLPVYIVNIKGIQHIGPSPLNLKVNRSKILAERLSPPQVSIQQLSRILISVRKQHSVDKVAPLAQSSQQILWNSSSVQPSRRVSLPLLANYSFLYCVSLRYNVLRYSLTLSLIFYSILNILIIGIS